MKFKKFKSTDNQEKRIALTSGHVFTVADKWVDLPEHAWQTAYASGCISEDFVTKDSGEIKPEDTEKVAASEALKQREIIDLIKSWVQQGDSSNFKKDGTPNTLKVRQASGYEVDNAYVKDCYLEALKELEE